MRKQTQYRHAETRMVSRFSIAILGCTILGMALGKSLPLGLEIQAFLAGAIALLFYGYEARRDFKLRKEQSETCRQIVEMRLEQHAFELSSRQHRTARAGRSSVSAK
ncbi:hypothetical protein [Thalassoglobus polymorphus]|uniref:Uncharacterized protein n=1 Tax=Thalassoglobus polymorphus TaxID=2527994 RepID=A0A517QJ30_9PLAN|nr:hypothetical protein [Thalassoglobus polymorphus]QDT31659.1 hypothetical protein Mal48_08940 [Thalassoglobus polymorphus]